MTDTAKANPKRPSRHGSFLQRMGMSFRRSAGERGADVKTLRGTTGADFEGKADISRGDVGQCCGCFGGGGVKEQLLLVKGPFCFVFGDETDPAPKYAINLCHMQAVIVNEKTVNLETNLGEIEYVITFEDDVKNAELFKKAVSSQASMGEAEEVRKRLGHGNLVKKRESRMYAESIAIKKLGDQPEKPAGYHLDNDDMGVAAGM